MDRSAANDEFCLLACDGVWNVLTSEAAVAWLRARLALAASIGEVLRSFVDHVLLLGSQDNVSVLLVLFPAAMALAPHLAGPPGNGSQPAGVAGVASLRRSDSILLAPVPVSSAEQPVELAG